jgi:hypothetical protein
LFAIPEEQVSLKTYPYIVKYFIFNFQDKSNFLPAEQDAQICRGQSL